MEKLQTMVAGSPLETMVVAGSPLEMAVIKEKVDQNCKMNMYCVKPGHNQISCLRLTLCVNLLHLARLIVAVVALIHVSTTCWQPGIQEGAADWDENWDKFEDEVKELTLDVENVVAPLQLSVKHLPQKRVYMFHQQMLIVTQKRHQVEGKGLPMMLIAKTA
ncbi:hypothetical protein TEA_000255 [Camellia sinensis var. sinensis]|uniref:Uncharacterized protein n=1 Tax=Camellia sinensis var. sinensis TaxID=542762 RepID=A0A4V3WLT3_CAMSN|nr:hypothetical protein TEA_000255 [Camellia sinensis var. sinensis]